jgi:hypothetical protein
MEEAFLISLPTDAVVLIIYAMGSLIWPGCGRVRVSIELLPQLNLHGPTTQLAHQIMTIASKGVRIERRNDSIWSQHKTFEIKIS